MKRFSIYKKFIVINLIVLFACVLFGSKVTKEILSSSDEEKKFFQFPRIFAEHLIADEIYTEKAEVFKKIVEDQSFPSRIWVYNKKNELIYSNVTEEPPSLPTDIFTKIGEFKDLGFRKRIIAFKNEDRYLIYEDRMPKKLHPHFVWLSSMFISITLGMSLLAMIIFYYFRKNGAIANDVIGELKKGNLKARFPVKKVDEIGEVMTSFNSMADEIERLVEELRHGESVRINLLQELAHDLRTPVSSMKTMLETMVDRWDETSILPDKTKKEFAELSLREVNYFARLVEDLLFLGRVSEPKYHRRTEEISIKSIIESEVEIIEPQYSHISFSLIGSDFTILGDGHLIGRLIRNALMNAAAHTKDYIHIKLKESSIIISDNGKGFPENVLNNFGEKKFSRVMDLGRVSVGLGSVIMKRIAEIHKGKIGAHNDPQNGAVLTIFFG